MNRFKRGVAIWSAAGALLLAWAGLAWGVNHNEWNKAEAKIEQNIRLEHFYRVVGGELSGQESGPANKLARDLHDLPTSDLTSFTGDSNRYGGITDDLGFDPFNGVDCNECGKLDVEIINAVEQIKSGQLFLVLIELEREEVVGDLWPEVPGALWALWVIALPAGLGTMYVLKRRDEENRYEGVAEERRLLERLNHAKDELPVGSHDWVQLAQLGERLEEQIETRVSYRRSKTQELKLEGLKHEASNALDDIAAGNRALN